MTDSGKVPSIRTLEPCEHMVNAVNGLADGSLKGPMKVYTKLHTLHCSKCRTALNSLTVLHTRLGALSVAETAGSVGLSTQHQASIEHALDEIERRRSG